MSRVTVTAKMEIVPAKRISRKRRRKPTSRIENQILTTIIQNPRQSETTQGTLYVGSRKFTYTQRTTPVSVCLEFLQRCFNVCNSVWSNYTNPVGFVGPYSDMVLNLIVLLLDINNVPQRYVQENIKFFQLQNSSISPEIVSFVTKHDEVAEIYIDNARLSEFIKVKLADVSVSLSPRLEVDVGRSLSSYWYPGIVVNDNVLENFAKCIIVADHAVAHFLISLACPFVLTDYSHDSKFYNAGHKLITNFLNVGTARKAFNGKLHVTAKVSPPLGIINPTGNLNRIFYTTFNTASNLTVQALTTNDLTSINQLTNVPPAGGDILAIPPLRFPQ